MRILGAITVGALAVALSLAVAGCGGSSSSLSLDDVAQAAAKTSDRGSFASSLHMTMTLLGGVHVNLAGKGAYDVRRQRSSMTMDMSDVSRLTGQDLGTMKLVQTGTVLYMGMPALQSQIPGGKPWVKLDLQQAGKKMGIDISAFMQLGSGASHATWLQNLRAAGDLTRLGTEDVRGVHTTHYRVVVDLRKVPETVPKRLRARIRASTEKIIQMTGQARVPEELWIAADGLVRRLRLEQRIPVGASQGKLTMTMDLYDFGRPVHVTVPPADQVTDISELLNSNGSS